MNRDFIALDWGTTSFRAYRVSGEGAIAETRSGSDGILSVADRAFEPVLERYIANWDPGLPVLASGMITSRQGWLEVPYADAPAGLHELARGIQRLATRSGRQVLFIPGISHVDPSGVPDVIRGEETQVMGTLGAGDGVVVTRGTHCKWIAVEGGRIVRFATFVTGELFGALKSHTILGRLMTDDAEHGDGFLRGVVAGLRERTGSGLLHDLFSVRTLGLFDAVSSDKLAAYLSGLLIGAEIAGARIAFDASRGITVIGAEALAKPFAAALAEAGIASRLAPADAAVRGLLAIGKEAQVLT